MGGLDDTGASVGTESDGGFSGVGLPKLQAIVERMNEQRASQTEVLFRSIRCPFLCLEESFTSIAPHPFGV